MEISQLSRQILRELCTDSRITITELSEKFNVSRHVIKERVLALEKEFGLRYTIEPNYQELGYNTVYILHSKFKKKPQGSEIREIFSKSKVAQFVATVESKDFDIITFALAKSMQEYLRWETTYNSVLAKYGVYTRESVVNVMHLGFLPLSQEAIDDSKIDDNFKNMLKLLNENSRMSIRDLSKEMGLSEALTRYYFRELGKTKVIKRFTAIATKPYFKYNIIFFVNYTIKTGVAKRVDKERRTMYWKPLDEFPVMSEFPIMWSTSGSDRAFVWASYNDYKTGLKLSVEAHRAAFKEDEPDIETGTIKEIVKGYAPVRNLDQKENYETVNWETDSLM